MWCGLTTMTHVTADVDILVGLDNYWRFVDPRGGIELSPGLVAVPTVFGTVISGPLPQGHGPGMINAALFCQVATLEDVQKFWELESVGTQIESECDLIKDFKSQLSKPSTRYETGLLWKPGMKERLLDNFKIAQHRQRRTSRRLPPR